MANDTQIKKMHEAKIKRWDDSGVSASIGGLMHDAVQIVIARYNLKDFTGDELVSAIKMTLDSLYDIVQEKKNEVNHIPTSTFGSEQAIKETEDWQKHYNDISRGDDVKEELLRVANL